MSEIEKRDWQNRLRQRDLAARALPPTMRTRTCGTGVGAMVGVHYGDGGMHLSGVETCGSVWTCPVCAAKIAAKRSEQVTQATETHMGEGGAVYFVTLTAPHWVGQDCKHLKEIVSSGWSKLIAGAPWKRIKANHGITGYIRALETKHGKNGWHNHLHCLIYTDKPVDDLEAFRWTIFERWSRIIKRLGGGQCSVNAMDIQEIGDTKGADYAKYISKMGMEITHLHHKGLKGGLAPFQLLERSSGDRKAKARFREFALAFKGARQLTWSKGLKRKYGVDDSPAEDANICRENEERPNSVLLKRSDYNRIRRSGKLITLVKTAMEGGQEAVNAFVDTITIKPAVRETLQRREFYYDGVIPEQACALLAWEWNSPIND